MPRNRLRGDAQDIAQVTTLTVGGTAAAGQVYTATMNGNTVTYTAAVSDTNTLIATGLQAALAASTIEEYTEVTWSNATTVVTGTSETAGIPFTVTGSATGTGTLTVATTTSASGKNWWSTAANWSAGWIPQGACATPPVQSAAALVAGGSLSANTYYYVVTATNSNGETDKSNERSTTTSGGNLTIAVTWAVVNGATGYKVYRSTTAGSYGATSLMATISSGSTLTTNDTGVTLTTGTPPGSNTAVGDDVDLADSTVDLLYGVDQSTITLASLNIWSTYTGRVGLPDINQDFSYYEYRNTYLKIIAPTVNIGSGGGAGSSRIRLNLMATTSTVRVEKMGTPEASGKPALELIGTGASNSLHAISGDVGLAFNANDTATFPTVKLGYYNSLDSDVTVRIGSGCTLATVSQNGGDIITSASITTYLGKSGTLQLLDSAAVATMTSEGAYVYWQSTGAITTGVLGAGGVLDASRDLRGRTLTTLTMYKGSTLKDPYKTITFTNAFSLSHCAVQVGGDVDIDLGSNLSLQRS